MKEREIQQSASSSENVLHAGIRMHIIMYTINYSMSTPTKQSIADKTSNISIAQTNTPLTPNRIGNCYALCYKRNNPLITIGPNCNWFSRAIVLLRNGNCAATHLSIYGKYNVASHHRGIYIWDFVSPGSNTVIQHGILHEPRNS